MAVESDTHRLLRPFVVLATVTLVVVILYWAKDIFIPLALAILFTFILSPLVMWLQRKGLPRWPAAILITTLAAVLIAGVCWVTAIELRQLLLDLPGHTDTISKKLAVFQQGDDGLIKRIIRMLHDISVQFQQSSIVGPTDEETKQKPLHVVVDNEQTFSYSLFPAVAGPLLQLLVDVVLVSILVLFMLVKREDMQYRLIQLVGHGHLTTATHALYEAAQRTSNFLMMQSTINILFGVTLTVALTVLRVPYPLLWGFLAALLRFIPYAGTWVALLFPLALSVAVFPGWWQPITLLLFYLALELVVANLVEPLLLGHSTGISPIALLLAAAFWTWLWGPIGLVLATPLTVCLSVLGRHIPALSFLHVLLGSEPVLDPPKQFYQRLLAQDPDEASGIVEEAAKKEPVETVYDKILVPALVMLRQDQQRGELTEDLLKNSLQTIGEIQETVAPTVQAGTESADGKVQEAVKPSEEKAKVNVVGYAAGDQLDEMALQMFRALVEGAGYSLTALSSSKLSGEIVALVEAEKPAVICIASLPPGGLARVSYLCKRLRGRMPDLQILVGRWGQEEMVTAKQRLQAAGANDVANTLLETRKQLIPLLQHFSVRTEPEDKPERAPAVSVP